MTSLTSVRLRTVKCAKAFDAIEKIRGFIEQAEQQVVLTANGEFPPMDEVVSAVHSSRECLNEILMNLVEARLDSEEEQEK